MISVVIYARILMHWELKMDPEKNKVRGKAVDVAADDSKVRIFIIPTNEELVIARDTYRLAQ